MFRSYWFVSSLVVTCFAMQTRAATPELREKLAGAAADILAVTKNQPVKIGKFTDDEDTPNTNSGPGIAGILEDEINRLKPGGVSDDARFLVKGDFGLVPSLTKKGVKSILIRVDIIDRETKETLLMVPVKISLTGTHTLATVLQVQASISPEGSQQERNQQLIEQATNPEKFPVHLTNNNTRISSSSTSKYAVEVAVKPLKDHKKNTAKPRPAALEDGQAFVQIGQGELYELNIFNNSDRPVAVRVSIDGYDLYHFSKDRTVIKSSSGKILSDKPRFTHMILPRRKQRTLVGWFHTISAEADDNYLSFLVTDYGKGASARTGKTATGSVGVIHVQFSECSELKRGQRAAPGKETGFGPPRKARLKAVTYEIEPPHDFVSVRYAR